MKKKQTDDEKKDRRKRIIIYIIIIIIIILSLITSCSCTSRFWGRLGKFSNSGDYSIDDNTEDLETVTNKDLTFDNDYLEMLLSDNNGKISFSYKNINPTDFSCRTRDASIATCYVSKGYVVVNPKAIGEVTVILQTKTNGKIYEATAKVVVTDTDKAINLSSNKGTINLYYSKNKSIVYTLDGLSGDIKVVSSDPLIATGVASNGILKITAYKTGDVAITVSINYNGKEYQNVYNLSVINKKNTTPSKPNEGNNKPDKPNTGEQPENPDVPDIPDEPDTPEIPDNPSSGGSTSSSLTIIPSKGFTITSIGSNKYEMEVAYDVSSVPFRVSPSDGVTYKLRDKTASEITELELLPGWNEIEINSSRGKAIVRVYRSILKAQIDGYVTCNFGQSCNVPYEIVEVLKDGSVSEEGIPNKEDFPLDIKFDGPAESVQVKDGVIVVKPLSTIQDNDEIKLTVDIKDYQYDTEAKSTVKFSVDAYYVKPATNSYEMRYTSSNGKNDGEKAVIVNTNMFEGAVEVVSRNDSYIKICAKNNSDLCVEIEVPSNFRNKIEISVDDDKLKDEEIKSLPINIKVKDGISLDEEIIQVTVGGKAYTKNIGPENVKIKVIKAYKVDLDPKNGKFNTNENPYTLLVDYNGTRSFDDYEPVWYDSTTGEYHEFLGYSKTDKNNEDYLDSDIDYKKGSEIKGEELTGNIPLYAVYAKDSSKIPCEVLAKTFWIKDLEIFNNVEAENLYGDKKLIYPSASGEYVMRFKNNTSADEIYITGLTLTEDTICVTGGCLNMGYIIRANEPEREYYYYGKLKDSPYDNFQNENYKILNEGNKTSTSKKINLESQKPVQVKKTGGDYDASITLFWRWIDYNTKEMNKVDTLIGEEAAKTSADLLYKLSIGVTYKVPDDMCS